MIVRLVVEDSRHNCSDEDGEVKENREPVPGQEPNHGEADELHQEAPQAGDRLPGDLDTVGGWVGVALCIREPSSSIDTTLWVRISTLAAGVLEGDDLSHRVLDDRVR